MPPCVKAREINFFRVFFIFICIYKLNIYTFVTSIRRNIKKTDMKTREFIKAGLVKKGVKVMVNKGAEYQCGRHSDHSIAGYVREAFEATCLSTPKISIHSNGIKEYEYAHLTCVDINGLEYCIDISHCKYSNVDSQKDVTILL